MIRRVWPLAALLAVAACSGAAIVTPKDDDDDGGGGGETTAIPAALSNNLKAVRYDGTTMKVTIDLLDSTPAEVTYDRDARLDVPGYTAYRMQEDSLDRLFVALGAISDDGSVQAVTVGDGGQFNRYFAGGSYDRAGGFDRPEIGTGPGRGQVSYAGSYAAVTNVDAPRDGGPDDVALPISGTVDPINVPAQPGRITGDIFLNANFNDNTVNGAISNRVLVDTNYALADVILVPGTIAEDGTFTGSAEYSDLTTIGSYGGIFGGTDANSVAGLVHLTEFERNWTGEQEHGVFVLTQCGPNNTLPICDNVAP
ncbi:hypothetical protein [Rhodobacter capsulatus]|uniref:hypothetical protein n=1 Tax=Rhodobacter capsulatus TaxID=1061 RepID=UPI0003D2A9F3|nr:hypothetical protein [Rhodobacter capsulatus]ETD87420.1 hypothetical protein U716_00895 [Rhodobacter capsulatus B6]